MNTVAASNAQIQKIHEWIKFDQFVLAQIDYLVNRMEKMNETLGLHVQKLLEDRIVVDAARSAIGDVFRISMQNRDFEGIERLVHALGKNSSIDSDLKALIGMIHYNMLLCRRFAAFRTAVQVLDVLYMKPEDAATLRTNMRIYGLDLQYIWKHCYSQCKTLAETELFDRALGAKATKSAA